MADQVHLALVREPGEQMELDVGRLELRPRADEAAASAAFEVSGPVCADSNSASASGVRRSAG